MAAARRLLAGVSGALVLAGAAPARAEPVEAGALRLDWSAPGGCPNAVETLGRIEALLGSEIEALSLQPLAARGVVTEIDPKRFHLDLETFAGEQRFARSMQAPSCTELTDAGALVLALALDPTLAERRAALGIADSSVSAFDPPPTPRPLPPPEPAPVPAPQPPAPPPRDSAPDAERMKPPSERELRVPVRAGAVLDLGTVDGVALGARASAGLDFGALRVELGGIFLPARRSFASGSPDKGGDIELLAAGVAGCVVPLRSNLDFRGCLELEVGRLHGEGFGTAADTSGSVTWLGLGAAAGLGFSLYDPLRLVAVAGALASPQPVEFTLENIGLVHRVPALVGRLGLGLESQF